MASYNIIFCVVLASFLSFANIEAQDAPVYVHSFCSSDETIANSTFQFDLRILLSYLSANATGDTQFYNTTVTGKDPSDSVYGLFMCRGDVPSQLCQKCVLNATQRLPSDCSLYKEAIIWYDECMVRYSNSSFFTTLDTSPILMGSSLANVSNPDSFNFLLNSTMNETADLASSSPIGERKFATKEATVSGSQTLYSLAQCTPYLSPQDCRACLAIVISEVPMCCEGKQGGRILNPSCNIRYESYPFYLYSGSSPAPAPVVIPATTYSSDADSKFAEDPIYLSHNCTRNKTFTADNTVREYIKTLLSNLSSYATNTSSNKKFTVNVADTMFGLFMCRGDLPPRLCGQCVQNATHRISSECGLFKEAIIWYSHCMLRYSYKNFFSKVDTSPKFYQLNLTDGPIPELKFLTFILSNKLSQLPNATGDSGERYVTQSLKLNDLQTLYTLGQCTHDLSSDGCSGCLADIIGITIPWSHLGSVGGRVIYPSCSMRFELFQFYRDGDEAQLPNWSGNPSSLGPTEKKDGQSRRIILIVVATIAFAMLVSFGYYWLRRKARKSHKTILKENFGQECATLEPLRFDLTIIEAATNKFAYENRIGKGGFGEVYKGILLDGRQIAVKRLSRSSKQGDNEFKNEILLIAKLQHRNLVAFIGFCLEEEEKILIYEYVPNRSLDYFLYDSRRQKLLSWFERYNIIRGIARGILYLHEHSDSKLYIVISNLWYMPPEYTMFGQFSEKTDVFSFGVMVLEIITGKRNASSYESHCIADGLLSYVWRQWRDHTPLSTLDLNIKEDYSESEVNKCIQIGLLCVQQNPEARPTMATIVLYLSSQFIELPKPQEPAFFLQGGIDTKNVAQESSSSQSINTSAPVSMNEMPISEFIPR